MKYFILKNAIIITYIKKILYMTLKLIIGNKKIIYIENTIIINIKNIVHYTKIKIIGNKIFQFKYIC